MHSLILIIVLCAVAATALPTKPQTVEEEASENRDAKFIIPIYNNGKVPGAANTRTFLTGTSNNAIIQTLLKMLLPPGVQLYTSAVSTAPNADGATPTVYLFSPLSGLTPVGATGRQFTNPCENGIDCAEMLLQNMIQAQSTAASAYSSYSPLYPIQQGFQSIPAEFASQYPIQQGFQSIPAQFASQYPIQLGFQSIPAQFASQYPIQQGFQSTPAQFASHYPIPQYPSLFRQPQVVSSYALPNVQMPVVVGQYPVESMGDAPTPQLVLYDSPLSFLEDIALSVDTQNQHQFEHAQAAAESQDSSEADAADMIPISPARANSKLHQFTSRVHGSPLVSSYNLHRSQA